MGRGSGRCGSEARTGANAAHRSRVRERVGRETLSVRFIEKDPPWSRGQIGSAKERALVRKSTSASEVFAGAGALVAQADAS